MLRKLSAAVIAVSLIAGPVLAQTPGSVGTSTAPASSTSHKAAVSMTGVKKVKHVKRHTAKVAKHVQHVKHVKHVKHSKHLKHVKQLKHPAKNKTAG